MAVEFHLSDLQVHQDDYYRLEFTVKDDGVMFWDAIRSLTIEVRDLEGRPTPNKRVLAWRPTEESHRLVFQQIWFNDVEVYERYRFVVTITFSHGYKIEHESNALEVIPEFSY
ncbi:hypothetical protein GQX73_g3790 [Xylaria multiplex]|uniref:Uncharacterized protein n=1 Tax=Xylaria multiplex TaxID=323545 RepID=A0A7C8ITU7_9PEZI|nr:hypothetical protein GQX73_g3790 [Xylaria multiplex]